MLTTWSQVQQVTMAMAMANGLQAKQAEVGFPWLRFSQDGLFDGVCTTSARNLSSRSLSISLSLSLFLAFSSSIAISGRPLVLSSFLVRHSRKRKPAAATAAKPRECAFLEGQKNNAIQWPELAKLAKENFNYSQGSRKTPSSHTGTLKRRVV